MGGSRQWDHRFRSGQIKEQAGTTAHKEVFSKVDCSRSICRVPFLRPLLPKDKIGPKGCDNACYCTSGPSFRSSAIGAALICIVALHCITPHVYGVRLHSLGGAARRIAMQRNGRSLTDTHHHHHNHAVQTVSTICGTSTTRSPHRRRQPVTSSRFRYILQARVP